MEGGILSCAQEPEWFMLDVLRHVLGVVAGIPLGGMVNMALISWLHSLTLSNRPPTITREIVVVARIDSRGFASSRTRSALFPASIVPH